MSGHVFRASADLVSGGRAHVWVGDRFVIIVAHEIPLIIPPRQWRPEETRAFADALAEAAMHIVERKDPPWPLT